MTARFTDAQRLEIAPLFEDLVQATFGSFASLVEDIEMSKLAATAENLYDMGYRVVEKPAPLAKQRWDSKK